MSSQNQQFQDEADKDKNLNQELDEAQKHTDSRNGFYTLRSQLVQARMRMMMAQKETIERELAKLQV